MKRTLIDKIAKAYQPKIVESKKIICASKPIANQCNERFTLLFPPPNVTGDLHLGHALTLTIQDVLARHKRDLGYNVSFVPGFDHAGIATQIVVEKNLWSRTGKTRHDIGRDEFIQEIWKWKKTKESSIKSDFEKMGITFDWDREYFTLDEKRSNAVKEAFVQLHDKGIIYRKKSLINWSCILESAISDIEVESVMIEKPTKRYVPGYSDPITFGQIYDISYKLFDSNEEIVISTTRPETLLADVAVAVNPNDPRYSKYLNSETYLWHPFRKCPIPVIFDISVDMEFGTGAVKITPPHDKNDFEVAKQHGLPLGQSVIAKNGKMISPGTPFNNLARFQARTEMISALTDLKLFRGVRPHKMNLPVCSRSNDIIEYLMQPQWFVDCSKMSNMALKSVTNGEIKIYPAIKTKEWIRWLADCKDWCISRQLWWGHQIPAYEIDIGTANKVWIAARSKAELDAKIQKQLHVSPGDVQIKRDPDVLDTWFSSGLLPLSCFGWPHNETELNQYYPLSLMETGHDILFFWLARMVMLGKHFTGKVPFNKILLHGVICDQYGRKMSKSLGNVIVPDQVINGCSLDEMQAKLKQNFTNGVISQEEYGKSKLNQEKSFPTGIPECGVDALRFTLCSSNVQSHFINFDINECHTNKLFFNKIWQATKYFLISLENNDNSIGSLENLDESNLSKIDQWILSRLAETVDTVNAEIEKYHFHLATAALKNFFYYNFCDIYLEATKPALNQNKITEAGRNHLRVLAICLSIGLQNMSYFTPYLSAELLSYLPDTSAISKNLYSFRNLELEQEIDEILEISASIRQINSQHSITRKLNPIIVIHSPESEYLKTLISYSITIKSLILCDNLEFLDNGESFDQMDFLIKSTASHNCVFGVSIQQKHSKAIFSDVNAKKLDKLEKSLDNLNDIVSKDGYIKSASHSIKEKHAKKIQELQTEIEKLRTSTRQG